LNFRHFYLNKDFSFFSPEEISVESDLIISAQVVPFFKLIKDGIFSCTGLVIIVLVLVLSIWVGSLLLYQLLPAVPFTEDVLGVTHYVDRSED